MQRKFIKEELKDENLLDEDSFNIKIPNDIVKDVILSKNPIPYYNLVILEIYRRDILKEIFEQLGFIDLKIDIDQAYHFIYLLLVAPIFEWNYQRAALNHYNTAVEIYNYMANKKIIVHREDKQKANSRSILRWYA
jgi:hypothetical protein